MCVIVDTNVPIVANGRSDPADAEAKPSPGCQLAAIDFLERVLNNEKILLDLDGEIETEYRRYLNPSGQPQVGDRFYFQVLMSQPHRVERIHLPKGSDGEYEDFPVDDPELDAFDHSDRKFAALARRTSTPVSNATDSDWVNHREALERNGITIQFVCGCDSQAWYGR